MHSERDEVSGLCAKLLIVCLKSETGRVRSIISRHAPSRWQDGDEIKIFAVTDGFRSKFPSPSKVIKRGVVENNESVLHRLNKLVPDWAGTHILLVGSVPHDVFFASKGNRIITPLDSCDQLEKRLPSALGQCGLDWRSRKVAAFGHYDRWRTDQHQLWLKQFGKLGCAWIGEALFQLADFWSSSKFGDILFESPRAARRAPSGASWLQSYDFITYGDTSSGNSSAVIARAVAKRWPDLKAKTKELPELINIFSENSLCDRSILYLEDCIMTGNECFDILEHKLLRLTDKNRIDFKFAVGTDFGVERLRHYLRKKSLTEVSVIEPVSGRIENLTEPAIKLARRDQLFDEFGRMHNRARHIRSGIDLCGKGIFNDTQRKLIHDFCRRVGRQLMFSHFQKAGNPAAAANDMADEHTLGFGNLGLLTIFAHSVPDNTIPLFWGDGPVAYGGRQVDWVPLFPQRQETQCP